MCKLIYIPKKSKKKTKTKQRGYILAHMVRSEDEKLVMKVKE